MANLAVENNRIRAFKGHFTKAIKAFQERVGVYKANVGIRESYIQMVDSYKKLKQQFDKCDAQYSLMQELEPAEAGWITKYDETYNAMDEATKEYDNTVLDFTKRHGGTETENKEDLQQQLEDLRGQLEGMAAPGGATTGPRRIAKAEQSLKPDLLTASMTPSEYRIWQGKYNDYSNASYLESLPMKGQLPYLKNCVDADLLSQMDLEGTTTLKQALDIVETQFMTYHPLINRRVDMMRIQQKEGQLMSEHVTLLKKAGREADIDHMSPDEFKAVLIISSCNNQELLGKLLEVDKDRPAVDELDKVINSYEARKLVRDNLSATTGKHQSRRTPADTSSMTCYVCAKTGHMARDCKFPKNKLWCSVCKSKTHNKGAVAKCKKPPDEPAERGRGEKKKKGVKSRRSNTPHPEGSGNDTDTEGGESDAEPENQTRRVTTRRAVSGQARRAVQVSCRQGVSTYPTPSIDLTVRTTASKRNRGKEVSSVPDTGCTASIISEKEAKKCKLQIDTEVDIDLTDAAGKKMRTLGTVYMFVEDIEGHIKRIEAIVSPDLADPALISWRDLIRLGYLPPGWPNIGQKARKTSTSSWPPAEWGQEVISVVEEFKHLFQDELKESCRIVGPPVDIDFKDNAVLPQITHCRSIPFHLQAMADRVLQKGLDAGTWERDGGTTSKACSPAHFVLKPSGEDVRIVCDMRMLNKAVKRPVHVFPTGNDVWRCVKQESRVFFKLDLVQGYHQIPLSKRSREYFTFLTPQGKFRYTVCPMGFVGSGDYFNQATDRALWGIPGTKKEVDDILGQAVDNKGLAEQLREVLQRCADNNITLSRKKMMVGPQVNFAGFVISKEGCKPDPGKILALKNVESPRNITELRSFLGAINQMTAWWPDLSMACHRIRELLEAGTEFQWRPEHEEAFQKVKDILSDTANLAPFDPMRKTELITDASKLGLGFVLIQYNEVSKIWELIWAGSTSLKGSQMNYPPIQLELLGLTWALQQCKYYLQGHPGFHVKTDHHPLVGLTKKHIRDVSERLQSMAEVCSTYNFTIEYIKGKTNLVADLLSRQPIWRGETGAEVVDICNRVVADNDYSRVREDPRIVEILQAAAQSTCYKEAVKAKLDGLSQDEVKKLPDTHGARSVCRWWNDIGLLDNKEDTIMIMGDSKIMVPKNARQGILKLLHVPHMATSRTRKAASARYFWVGMGDEVKKMCESCQTCRERGPSRPAEPMDMPDPKATMEPMTALGLDMMQYGGVKYLICVDRYSGYPLVHKTGKTSSTKEVIKALSGWFRTFGYAKRARHDDGPEFRDKFVSWLKQVGCRSEVSSAYNPASNGLAESAVKNVKNLVKRCSDSKECFETALAEFRVAPREDGYSPAELFYKRQVRGLLPELPKKLDITAAELARDKVQQQYTERRQTRSQSKTLTLGERVWMQDQNTKKWTIEGVVKSVRNNGKSYVVETDTGAYLRNRCYLKAAGAALRRQVATALRLAAATRQAGDNDPSPRPEKTVRFKLAVRFGKPKDKDVRI